MADQETIYVVDDDGAVCEGLYNLLESLGISAKVYKSCKDFLGDYDGKSGGGLLLDVRMPGMSGLDLHQELASNGWDLPVIFITAHGDVQMAVKAMKAGAIDFIEKPFREQSIIDSVRNALSIKRKTLEHNQKKDEFQARVSSLTEREREVFDQMILGKNNRDIAFALDISPKTIDFHKQHVLVKMKVNSPIELMRLCMQAGYLGQEE